MSEQNPTPINPQDPVASGDPVVNGSYDYISAINEMKKNTVPRKAYEELIKERNQLADAVINGEIVAPGAAAKEVVDISALRSTLFSPEACDKGMTNMEYIENALKLRNAVLEQEGKDIFLPVGRGIVVTAEDREQAENAAEIFQECLDYAQGDPSVFNTELMRRTVDTGNPRTAKNNYYRR